MALKRISRVGGAMIEVQNPFVSVRLHLVGVLHVWEEQSQPKTFTSAILSRAQSAGTRAPERLTGTTQTTELHNPHTSGIVQHH